MIEDIERSSEDIRKEEIKEEEKEEIKAGKILIEDFNKISQKLKKPYFMKSSIPKYVHLFKKEVQNLWFIKLNEDKELKQMYYHEEEGKWSFCKDIDFKLFKEIEPILNECETKFEIRLVGGDIATKYKILKELKSEI